MPNWFGIIKASLHGGSAVKNDVLFNNPHMTNS